MRVETKDFSKKEFEKCLSKFRNKTKGIVLEHERSLYYERPQEERQRKRRKDRKRKKREKRLKKKHGKRRYRVLVDRGVIDPFEY